MIWSLAIFIFFAFFDSSIGFAGVYGEASNDSDIRLEALLNAYPHQLASREGNFLIWRDGTRMPISDGRTDKSFAELLDFPDLDDQFAFPYPTGAPPADPGVDIDPGRIRHEAFFIKMYGDCRKAEVVKNLRTVQFFSAPIQITTVNGIDEVLEKVVTDLKKIPQEYYKFIIPSAGGYNCRMIGGTNRLSAHAYGIAIDISVKYGDYWRWLGANNKTRAWRNQIPIDIIKIFERHGFIWGGRWSHFDTLHFEYRPEMFDFSKQTPAR